MGKIKRIASSIFVTSLLSLLLAGSVYAANVAISQLPEYTHQDYFKLSCTALGGTTAQFSYKKEGGTYATLGPSINLNTDSCLVDVNSTQIDSDGKYYFKVTTDVGDAETSTTYDTSGPSPVRDYSKEKIGTTTYRIHWTNPGESDFYQVYIYRGEAPDFSANEDKKVAGITGAPDASMTYDDAGLDPNKDYYYIIRALDKAGNSSSLVGDSFTVLGETTVTTTASTQTAGGEGAVTVLPKEEEQVLGEEQGTMEATPIPTPSGLQGAVNEAVNKFTSSKLLIGLGVLVFIGALIWYWTSRRKRNNY